jgi:DNA polymerase I
MSERTASIDIETDMTHETIWMAYVHYWDTDETIRCDTVEDFISAMSSVTCIAHWNGIGFDEPVLAKQWLWTWAGDTIDGMLLSRLLNPSRPGGHSLASYGTQFGYPKGDFTDYNEPAEGETEQEWLERMATYCGQDTKLCTMACKHIVAQLKKEAFAEESWELEHQVSRILTQQRTNGFKLDVDYASKLYRVGLKQMLRIERKLQHVFPPIMTERYSEKTGKRLKDGVEPFNIGSRPQIAKRLGSLGAVFPKLTEKGSVIVDETTLEAIDLPEAKLVLEYLTLQKRTSMIDGWLSVVAVDGRVHGRVDSNGAVTGRMTHSKPNMAQIVAVSKLYGRQMRSCWVVDEGNKLVGIDASGLELRMLAHYMKDEAYIKEILEGDVHTANQTAAGLETRDQAKTFIYAFLYGAGNEKIGSIVGGGARKGSALKNKFLAATPALAALKDLVSEIAEKHKSLPGLDGRRLRVRHSHAALNTLLQGAGAVVMKKAMVILDALLQNRGLPYKFVANVHDEWQIETTEEYADEVGKLGCEAIELAGQFYNMRCPLAGDYNVGNNWAETH